MSYRFHFECLLTQPQEIKAKVTNTSLLLAASLGGLRIRRRWRRRGYRGVRDDMGLRR